MIETVFPFGFPL